MRPNIFDNRDTDRFQLFFWLFGLNFLLTLLISVSYLNYAPDPIQWGEWLYARVAFVSNFAMIYLIIFLPLLILFAVVPLKWFAAALMVIILWGLDIFILIDIAIFKLFRFHINSLVWNVLTTEGSADSIKLGAGTVVTFIVWAILILGIEFGMSIALRTVKNKDFIRRFLRPSKLVYFLLFFLVINLIDKGIYAYGDLFNKTHITRYARLFPLYQPLTIKRYAKKNWGFEVNREFNFDSNKTSGLLNYPLTDLEFVNEKKTPNIILIVVDSWRYDMLTPEVTPNMYEFSRGALNFRNHYSGGNSTRFGIFSLFYGLHGSYWHSFISERIEPVLLQALRARGYAIKIISSTQLTFPEFRKTAFVGVPDCIEDKLKGNGAKERDQLHAPLLASWLDSLLGEQPFFAFLFLDAPHDPYSYPKEFIKFRPSANEINYLLLDREKDVTPYKNHYRNAVFFDDFIVGNILNELRKRDLFESTIIMITGDHGAEFYERGFWGHNGAFSPEQVKVPFIFHLPGYDGKSIEKITSHCDVPATLLELMGCTIPAQEYSLGNSLLSQIDERRQYVVTSGWSESALIDSAGTVVFSTEIYSMGTFEVRNSEYELVQDVNLYLKPHITELTDVMNSMSRFYR